jgi:hypothetical protein
MLDFVMNFLFKSIQSLSIDRNQPSIENEIVSDTMSLTINEFKISLNSIEKRMDLYNKGVENAKLFISKLSN